MVEARCGSARVTLPVLRRQPGDPPDDLAWVPAGLRETGRGGGDSLADLDLDVLRAVVAVAWALADSGDHARGAAQVHGAPG